MYLLKKVIQLRENSHPDHEKPFLEHLEDLRTMIFRLVVTLVISMVVCFAFNKKLMEFFRHPVDEVLLTQTKSTLPAAIPVATWERARKVEHAAGNLTPPQREHFYQSLDDPGLVFLVKSMGLYRAALAVPEAKREAFVNSLAEGDDFKLQVKSLLVTKPNPDSDAQGNLKMMSALKPTEGFMLSMKLSFVAGIVISFPLLLMFVLQFVLPGLHQNEKRVLWPSMIVGFGLFLCGTTFAYYLVLPRTLLFFYQWSGDMGISNDWRIGEYISFATQFTLLFGAAFELPVVVMVFVKLGLLGYETMSRTRSYAIVAIFAAAALLTPTPDIPTMCVMAAPMLFLYEICIWLAWLDRRKRRLLEASEGPAPAPPTDPEPTPWEPPVDPWNDEHAHHADSLPDHHPHEAGDDGWTNEFHPHDHHDTPYLPEAETPATPDLTSNEPPTPESNVAPGLTTSEVPEDFPPAVDPAAPKPHDPEHGNPG